MPMLKSVPELTDLVYKPVSDLIKNEALRVAHICVTKFHVNEEDEELIDIGENNENDDVKDNISDSDIQNNNHSFSMLTLDEHIKRR